MKKMIFLIVFVWCFPLFVCASSRYDVNELLIDATILENGDMHVKELIGVHGSFTQFTRNLTYKNSSFEYHNPYELFDDAIYNGTGLKDVSVQAKKMSGELTFEALEEEYTMLSKTYYREDAKNLEYVESSIQDGKTYMMFYESNYEKVVFLLDYELTDVVVLHNDIAEIYWPFLRSNFENTIATFQVRIHFPKKLEEQISRYWIHGDITGNIEKIDDQTILASFTKLSLNTDILIRAIFQKDMVKNIILEKQTNTDSYSKIVAAEDQRLQEDLAQYARTNKILNAVQIFCVSYFIFLFFWWVWIAFRYHLPYFDKTKLLYSHKIDYHYNVEVADILIHNHVSFDAFCASVLNLISKKNIKVKKVGVENYIFTLNHCKNINYTEELLIDFLFEKVGRDKTVDLNTFYHYVTGEKSSRIFANFYNNWVRCVKKDADQQHFFENNGLPIISSIFCLLVVIFCLFASVYFRLNTLLPWISFILTLAFCIYSWVIQKRTRKGQEDYLNFKALQRFLQNFSNFSKDDLPKVETWPDYLVYASLFGIMDCVFDNMMKQLSSNIGNRKIKNELTMMNMVQQKMKYALLLNYEMVYTKKS